jgi:NAD(P)-dependent dehydrogenase (short-subunit alcohol dehydrogenase family)
MVRREVDVMTTDFVRAQEVRDVVTRSDGQSGLAPGGSGSLTGRSGCGCPPARLFDEAARRLGDGGRIVNLGTSVLGMSIPFYGVYAGSKASLEHLSRDLAHQLHGRGITVNTVAPGALDTPFFYASESPESIAFIKQMTGGLGAIDDADRRIPRVARRAVADRADHFRERRIAHAMKAHRASRIALAACLCAAVLAVRAPASAQTPTSAPISRAGT